MARRHSGALTLVNFKCRTLLQGLLSGLLSRFTLLRYPTNETGKRCVKGSEKLKSCIGEFGRDLGPFAGAL
jgi:hypothetical protein